MHPQDYDQLSGSTIILMILTVLGFLAFVGNYTFHAVRNVAQIVSAWR